MSTLVTICVIVLVGTRVRDGLRLRQQEIVLAKLPEAAAIAYYDVLRRRVRNTRILRGIALVSVLGLMYAWKHGLLRVLTLN